MGMTKLEVMRCVLFRRDVAAVAYLVEDDGVDVRQQTRDALGQVLETRGGGDNDVGRHVRVTETQDVVRGGCAAHESNAVDADVACKRLDGVRDLKHRNQRI